LRRNWAADTLGLAPLPAPRRPDDDQPCTPTIDVTGAPCHAGGLPPDAEPGGARVTITHGDVIAAVDELLPLVRRRVDDIQAGRRLSDDVELGLRASGVNRMVLPAVVGGFETPPARGRRRVAPPRRPLAVRQQLPACRVDRPRGRAPSRRGRQRPGPPIGARPSRGPLDRDTWDVVGLRGTGTITSPRLGSPSSLGTAASSSATRGRSLHCGVCPFSASSSRCSPPSRSASLAARSTSWANRCATVGLAYGAATSRAIRSRCTTAPPPSSAWEGARAALHQLVGAAPDRATCNEPLEPRFLARVP
jgi:hypothetical protein